MLMSLQVTQSGHLDLRGPAEGYAGATPEDAYLVPGSDFHSALPLHPAGTLVRRPAIR